MNSYDLPPDERPCPLCAASTDDAHLVIAGEHAVAFLPERQRAVGAVAVVPRRHVVSPTELSSDEQAGLWAVVWRATAAVEAVYDPDGMHTWHDIGTLADAPYRHLLVNLVPRRRSVPYVFVPLERLAVLDPRDRVQQAVQLRDAAAGL